MTGRKAQCGASFEWVGRSINPCLGFMTGWLMITGTLVGVVSGVVVLAPSVLAVFGSTSTSTWPDIPDPRYQKWIDTYGGEEFGDTVRKVLAVADALGPGLAPAERALVHRHFRATSRCEWMFWDMGYRRETWPV
jgi:thiaminase/transcriptional activator TenA